MESNTEVPQIVVRIGDQMLRKLTKQHLEEVLKQSALGKKPTEICRLLEGGIDTGDGATLMPIQSIDESTIRKHIARRPEEIQEYRVSIYGDLAKEPLAYPAFRLRERRKLYDRCVLGADEARTGRGKLAYLTIAAKLLTDAGIEVTSLTPREGTQHKHVHLQGEGVPALTASLASRLAELGRAGMMDTAVEIMGSEGASASAREEEEK